MGDAGRAGRAALSGHRGAVDRDALRRRAPELVLAVVLLATTVSLVLHARQLWFIDDDWNFLLRRDAHPDSLIEPYNGPHWSVVPLLSFRTLFTVFGLKHYLVFAIVPIALHAAVNALMYAVLRRHDVPPWPALLAVAPLALCSAAVLADVLWAFQVGFMTSLAAGLLAVLLHRLGAETTRGLVGGWLAGAVSVTSSGMGVPMLVFWGLVVLLTQGLRRAVLAVAPPMLLYAGWYAAEVRDDGSGGGSPTPGQVVHFVWTGTTHLWQPVLGVPGAGIVFLVVLAVVSAVARVSKPVRAVALSGLAAAVFTYLLVGVGRAEIESGTASRFAYVGVLLTLPALALVLDVVARRVRDDATWSAVAAVASVVLVLGLAAEGLHREASYVDQRHASSPDLRERVLGARALMAENARMVDVRLHDGENLRIDVRRFTDPYVAARLPEGRATPQGRLDASVYLLATARTRPFQLPPARLEAADVSGSVTPTTGCTTVEVGSHGILTLPASNAGSQAILVPSEPRLRLRVVGPSGSSVVRELTVTPGTTTYVASVSRRNDLQVLLPPGGVSVCATAP